MDGLVWVDHWQVQSSGVQFAVGQLVTWPISSRLNAEALTEHVGAATAAHISMAVDWHASEPEDTVDHTGLVTRIEFYLCRHAQGRVIPDTVESHLVVRADGWEPERDAVHNAGYLVTLKNLRKSLAES